MDTLILGEMSDCEHRFNILFSTHVRDSSSQGKKTTVGLENMATCRYQTVVILSLVLHHKQMIQRLESLWTACHF